MRRYWSSLYAFVIVFPVVAVAQSSGNRPSDQARLFTAREVVERIKANVGISWRAETVDTFKAGDPDTRVTGVAVTMMATFEVLQRAVAAGDNFIITHEPTFYNHLDHAEEIPQKESDPVLAQKLAFIKEHGLVVWRFHDHWHERNPDGIEVGMVRALGWEAFQDKQDAFLFTIPEITLEKLAAQLKSELELHTMRVTGDPAMKVTRVALSPGAAGMETQIRFLEIPDVQLLITGESREWETVEYAADAVSEKRQKALIVLGHIPSEQAGMEECVRWLKPLVPEVRVEFVPAAQPFW